MPPRRSRVRVIFPDVHGAHRDPAACKAFFGDLKRLDPDEVIGLGDLLDCGGIFSSHARTYTNELTESYEDDCAGARAFLDAVERAAPKARVDLIEGNHEVRIERWATATFASKKDADAVLEKLGPVAALELKQRGIRYYRRSELYQGISIPGTIRRGKCYFTHGISAAKNAADVHLTRFGANVVFGHIHRIVAVQGRSVSREAFGAWSPGTLAKLQPLYLHTNPSAWSHGYAVQFEAPSGAFLHINVPIVRGRSLLLDVARRVA